MNCRPIICLYYFYMECYKLCFLKIIGIFVQNVYIGRYMECMMIVYTISNIATWTSNTNLSMKYIPLLCLQMIQLPNYYWFVFCILCDILSIVYTLNYFLYFLRILLIHNLFFTHFKISSMKYSIVFVCLGTFLPCLVFGFTIQRIKQMNFYSSVYIMLYSGIHLVIVLQSPIQLISNIFAIGSFIIWKQYSDFDIISHEAKLNKTLQKIIHK